MYKQMKDKVGKKRKASFSFQFKNQLRGHKNGIRLASLQSGTFYVFIVMSNANVRIFFSAFSVVQPSSLKTRYFESRHFEEFGAKQVSCTGNVPLGFAESEKKNKFESISLATHPRNTT